MTLVVDGAGRPEPVRLRLIRDRYLALLREKASPLLNDPGVVDQLVAQADRMITDAADALGMACHPPAGTGDHHLDASGRIGVTRAASGIHPAQSLQAAALLFQAAFPVLADLTGTGDIAGQLTVATVLNQTIMSHMAVAGEFYIAFLLERLHQTEVAQRQEISLELHDVVASAIALAAQNLDLHDAYRATDPDLAQQKLTVAKQAIGRATSAVRALAARTREDVEGNGFEHALDELLSAGGINHQLALRGRIDELPPAYREQLLL
ncbi:MAG: histidine kinase, partial [Actinomycetia bacterium]|nr:histidine kinase [Actinomycetes bacterium]